MPSSHVTSEQLAHSQRLAEIGTNRPSSQPSGARMSPKTKAKGGDSRQSPQVPMSVAVQPGHMIGASIHSQPQQLSPHSGKLPSASFLNNLCYNLTHL